MSNNGSAPGVDYETQVRKSAVPSSGSFVAARSLQPIGANDTINARVPGFEDITDQPDWGDNGFSGRPSDLRLVRFDRVSEAPADETQAEQAAIDSDA